MAAMHVAVTMVVTLLAFPSGFGRGDADPEKQQCGNEWKNVAFHGRNN